LAAVADGAAGDSERLVTIDAGSEEHGCEERAEADTEVEGMNPAALLVFDVGESGAGLFAEKQGVGGRVRARLMWAARSRGGDHGPLGGAQ